MAVLLKEKVETLAKERGGGKRKAVSKELPPAGEGRGAEQAGSRGERGPCASAVLCGRPGGSTERRGGLGGGPWGSAGALAPGPGGSGPRLAPLLPGPGGTCCAFPGAGRQAGTGKREQTPGSPPPPAAPPRRGGPAPAPAPAPAALGGAAEPRRGCRPSEPSPSPGMRVARPGPQHQVPRGWREAAAASPPAGLRLPGEAGAALPCGVLARPAKASFRAAGG